MALSPSDRDRIAFSFRYHNYLAVARPSPTMLQVWLRGIVPHCLPEPLTVGSAGHYYFVTRPLCPNVDTDGSLLCVVTYQRARRRKYDGRGNRFAPLLRLR